MGLQGVAPDQQHQGTCWKCRFAGPTPVLLDPAISVAMNSPDNPVHAGVRATSVGGRVWGLESAFLVQVQLYDLGKASL